jgi:tetratricopeptide (TPR) repeat protein
MLAGDPYAYWRAAAASLLEPWAHQPSVTAALLRQAADTNALVRANVMKTLGRLAEAGQPEAAKILRQALGDPVRGVRFQAAMALRAELDDQSPVGREFLYALAVNSDQPVGRMQQGLYQLARQHPEAALTYFQSAADWDPHSAAIRHELAVVFSLNGRTDAALREMREAVRLAPREAEYRYKLGLALHEEGDLDGAVTALEATVAMDARHARAWYNLGLARHAQGKSPAAVEALSRAETLMPGDARIPYAQATIWVELGRREEARAAVRRALAAEPDHREARQLLESLSR